MASLPQHMICLPYRTAIFPCLPLSLSLPLPPSGSLTHKVYNARLLVRQLEEELITLKKAYAQSAPEGPARADFVRHVKSAVAKHCTAHEAVEEAKDLHDAEPLLEMLGAEQKRFQALCTTVDREHPVKLLQQYQDQVLSPFMLCEPAATDFAVVVMLYNGFFFGSDPPLPRACGFDRKSLRQPQKIRPFMVHRPSGLRPACVLHFL